MTYITMPNIGEFANLGSQISQYFSLEAVAKINKKKLIFLSSSDNTTYGLKFARLLNISLDISKDNILYKFINISHNRSIDVDTKIFNLNNNLNYSFTDIFDSYRYWYLYNKDYVDNIEFKHDILRISKELLYRIKNREITISMHIRRGDYLDYGNRHFVNLEYDYYKQALSFFKEFDLQLIIFSNDIEWCQKYMSSIHDNIFFIKGGIDYIDLCLMSLCDHNIIANSSFSWWAAYFNKNINKKVICPKNYFKEYFSLANILNGNYYPKEWIAI